MAMACRNFSPLPAAPPFSVVCISSYRLMMPDSVLEPERLSLGQEITAVNLVFSVLG